MAQESQFDKTNKGVNPQIDDLISRAMADQKSQLKDKKKKDKQSKEKPKS